MIKGKVNDFKQGKTQTGKDNYSFKIDGIKYSGFGVPAIKNGDEIDFEFQENGMYKNVRGNIKVLSTATTPGELIGESAKKKRASEMMIVAKDLTIRAYEGEKIPGDIPEVKIAEITKKVKIVWADLMRQIGEDPNESLL